MVQNVCNSIKKTSWKKMLENLVWKTPGNSGPKMPGNLGLKMHRKLGEKMLGNFKLDMSAIIL
jgi:hypothetical protein